MFIKDQDSMHGTHRDGQRLPKGELRQLYDGDKLVLGAEVARGECEEPHVPITPDTDMPIATFFPVELEVTYYWSDEE